MTTLECLYIPLADADAYRAAGWAITDLSDTHHGRYSAIATRSIPTPALAAAHEPGACASVPALPRRLTPTTAGGAGRPSTSAGFSDPQQKTPAMGAGALNTGAI